jgi:hypothetical protein
MVGLFKWQRKRTSGGCSQGDPTWTPLPTVIATFAGMFAANLLKVQQISESGLNA